MRLVLFEDTGYRNLLPLVYFRPVWELLCGATSLAEKCAAALGDPHPHFLCRTYLGANLLPADRWSADLQDSDPALFVNGRWLPDPASTKAVAALRPGQLLACEGELVAACLPPKRITAHVVDGVLDGAELLGELPSRDVRAVLIEYPWDAVHRNGDMLNADFTRLIASANREGTVHNGVQMLNPRSVHIAPGATVQPNVVLDAQDGPVWIDSGATIMAGAVLRGPIYIGRDSRVKIGAKLYEQTTIGPVCKVGGEVEGSIIHGYSNKQHDGFLGHAYLGAWVNLGADTNNSDLKNNYGNVQAFINGRKVDTGQRFVGLFMGDHSKCAINTMFNTGTVVGTNCNVFGAGMPPKFLPSFSWGGAEGAVRFDVEKAMAVAAVVMGRRDVAFDRRQKAVFEAVCALAAEVEEGSPLAG